MSSTRPVIRLSDLVGKLYAHKREKEESVREAAYRRAVPAALKDTRLKSVKLEERARPVSPDDPSLTRESAEEAKRAVEDRRRRLKEVSEGKMTTADLRRCDSDTFEILQKYACPVHDELRNEEVHRLLEDGGAEAVLKPTVWKYTVAALSKVAPISITPRERELYGEDAYEDRLVTFAVKVAAGDPVDDELAVRFDRLDREGYTEGLLAELWEKYSNDAADAKLPKPSDRGKPDAVDESGEGLDELVTLSQVAPLMGLSKRTLERYLACGQLPKPDVPGGCGKAHKWFWRKLRRSLQKVAPRVLPKRFPGSQII